jgi:hypothetical protein
MCKLFNFKPQTPITWHVLSAIEVANIFKAAGVTCTIGFRDDYFWFPDENIWIDIITEAHAEMPAYKPITATERGIDCDKFAHHACDKAFIKYQANGCFEVWGQTTEGYHAWLVILTPNGAFEAEPQNNDIWAIGTNPHYKIKTVYRADEPRELSLNYLIDKDSQVALQCPTKSCNHPEKA